MKISVPKDYGKSTKSANAPPLPLIPEEEEVLTKENSTGYELLSVPADPDSHKYRVQVRVLKGDENLRTLLNWRLSVQKVIKGLNVTNYTNAQALAETLMTGISTSIFRSSLKNSQEKAKNEAIAAATDNAAKAAEQRKALLSFAHFSHIDKALQHVVCSLSPRNVLARVKRTVRRSMRKPSDMLVRTYLQHLLRINEQEIPALPPFGNDQRFSDDELTDIILFGTPKSWQQEMDRQGFDPYAKSPSEVIAFMENVEAAEVHDRSPDTKKKESSSSKSKSKNRSKDGSKNDKYCKIHGKGSHSTDECRTIQNEAKRFKSKSDSDKDGQRSKNKTWSRKADDARKDKELAAFIDARFNEKLEELHAISKKRKSDDDDSMTSLDLHALQKELDEFKDDDASVGNASNTEVSV